MGQISSDLQNLLPNLYSEMFHNKPNTITAKEIRDLDHDRFLEIISELNSLCRDSLDKEAKQMVFAVRKGSDQTILWKSIVEIACLKIDSNTKQVEGYRVLSLDELMKIFFTLKCQSAALGQSQVEVMSYSDILSNFTEEPDLSSTCSICFERKQDLILPCAHSFCTQCIEEWNPEHHTCPICRERLESTDDTWVLSEKPNAEDISKELELNIKELLDERNESCISS